MAGNGYVAMGGARARAVVAVTLRCSNRLLYGLARSADNDDGVGSAVNRRSRLTIFRVETLAHRLAGG